MCQGDVILGGDWLSVLRPGMAENALARPAIETVKRLPIEHEWLPNGIFFILLRDDLILLNDFKDTFLPYSLLHNWSDQYRFSGGAPSGSGTAIGTASTIAGYHNQAFLDATCRNLISRPSQQDSDNVTQREVHDAVYNDDLILELVRVGLSEEHWLFYSKVISEHMIQPNVATADGARVALIKHLFFGECVSKGGIQCKTVVQGERWPETMGMRVINLVSKCLDKNELSMNNLAYMCNALGLAPSKTQQRRLMLGKLARQRRTLLSTLDAANLSLQETMLKLGSSSTLDNIRAMCAAHGVPPQGEKDDLTDNLIGHISQGNCAGNAAPGCNNIISEVSKTVDSTIHTQTSILMHIQNLLSTR